jgi:ribonucleoside-diphosphate reductase alpha chain
MASTTVSTLSPTTTLKKGAWTDAALKVLKERYLNRRADGTSETPEQMVWRVASSIAHAEHEYGTTDEEIQAIAGQFYELLIERKFIPNSPTLMNAGLGNNLQYSACYVLPVEDSIEGIFMAIQHAAIVHQSGGGTGFAFSRLRPNGNRVQTSGGVASGPVSFMRVFDAATEAIKQGGRRRGANMGILRVDHPDIEEFITCKLDGGITNFNISIAATDAFMDALSRDEDFDLIAQPGWPVPGGGRYQGGEVISRKNARELFRKIVEAAWKTGDPGLVFIDRVNHSPANPTPEVGLIEATNPCGEQPLMSNEACNLGSIDLAKFVRPSTSAGRGGNGSGGNGTDPIDWQGLEEAVRLAVRFLDDVITVNPYPLPEIDEAVKANRRIGLGVMGWADMLFELGVPYDSQEALNLAGQVMAFINQIGHDEDARLAEARGPFPNWPRSIYKDGPPLRNSTVTTIAPTGSISIIAGTSSGIEPIFALAFRHIVKQPEGGERVLAFVNPIFERVAKERGFWSEELMTAVARRGTCHGVEGVPPEVQRVFVTAHEVTPEWHIRTQAAFQKHTDNGVSKTINLPSEARVDDVAAAYQLAYQTGCLGITVFRDGSKGEQVLNVGVKRSEGQQDTEGVSQGDKEETNLQSPLSKVPKPRPALLAGTTYRKSTPVGTAYITVNSNGEGMRQPFEVFINIGKAGSDTTALAEALGRLISLVLRLPSPLSAFERAQDIVGQMRGIGSGRASGFGPQRVMSLPDAVAQVLAEHVGLTGTEPLPGLPERENEAQQLSLFSGADLCPECGQATFVMEEGCKKCHACGFSEC